jgi:hypothetical protein
MTCDASYTTTLLEEIRDQNKIVLEAVADMPTKLEVLAIKDDLKIVADDVKTIKAVVTDLSRGVSNHEQRLTKLETS